MATNKQGEITMNTQRVQRWLTAAAVAAAAVVGGTGAAAAAPSTDPLAPITAAATSLAAGDIAAPQGMTTQTLIAARNAGFPIYEAIQVVTVYASKMGATHATEYRRVYDIDALNSPTTKIVGVGATPPDHFHVINESPNPIVVNMRPIENAIFQRYTYDTTPHTWWNSPLVHLPGGGPNVGVALVL